MSLRPLASLALAATALMSCSGSSTTPTEPPRPAPSMPDITGTWAGDLGGSSGEDWGHATVTLVQAGATLTGQLIAGNGTMVPLTGSLQVTSASIDIGGLSAGTYPCYLNLGVWFERDRNGVVVALPGVLAGRCPTTVGLSVRLVRSPAT